MNAYVPTGRPPGRPPNAIGAIRNIPYKPAGRTIERFHKSDAFLRALLGPFGSGKTAAGIVELIWRAAEQKVSPDGKRHSRWALIRNHYPELQTTTVRSFEQWMPRSAGVFKQSPPMTFTLSTDEIEAEFLFLALDRPEDVAKLLSLELTGALVDEAREVDKAVVDVLTGRVGRYPQQIMGGPSWSGVILISNPCDVDHWLYHMVTNPDKSDDLQLFRQPSGLSPEAENLQNLPGGRKYYERMSQGKDPEWIAAYVHGEWALVSFGLPVYPSYRDSVHTAPEPLAPVPGLPLILGADYGLTPAAVITQRLPDGRWLVVDEFCTEDAGVVRFSEGLVAYVRANYRDHDIAAVFADPAGNIRSQVDERTAIEVMREHTGWRVKAAPGANEWTIRRETVIAALNRMVDGRPGLQISPKCRVLRKGFAGAFHFRPIRASITGRSYDEKPAKTFESHVHDSLQYALLGAGDGDLVLNRVRRRDIGAHRPRMAKNLDYDVLNPHWD
jgi:hypothetical protein